MDDLGINNWLRESYGTTVDGLPLFRLIWNDNTVREHRFSEFHDHYGEVFLRAVREVREVLKYPYAQNRWILERIQLVDERAKNLGLRSDKPYSYEEIFTFQTKDGKFLPLSLPMIEDALALFFHYYLRLTPKEKLDLRIANLARKDLEKRNQIREIIGDGRAGHGFVLSSIKNFTS